MVHLTSALLPGDPGLWEETTDLKDGGLCFEPSGATSKNLHLLPLPIQVENLRDSHTPSGVCILVIYLLF
jgi:hypothetical protein